MAADISTVGDVVASLGVRVDGDRRLGIAWGTIDFIIVLFRAVTQY